MSNKLHIKSNGVNQTPDRLDDIPESVQRSLNGYGNYGTCTVCKGQFYIAPGVQWGWKKNGKKVCGYSCSIGKPKKKG